MIFELKFDWIQKIFYVTRSDLLIAARSHINKTMKFNFNG